MPRADSLPIVLKSTAEPELGLQRHRQEPVMSRGLQTFLAASRLEQVPLGEAAGALPHGVARRLVAKPSARGCAEGTSSRRSGGPYLLIGRSAGQLLVNFSQSKQHVFESIEQGKGPVTRPFACRAGRI